MSRPQHQQISQLKSWVSIDFCSRVHRDIEGVALIVHQSDFSHFCAQLPAAVSFSLLNKLHYRCRICLHLRVTSPQRSCILRPLFTSSLKPALLFLTLFRCSNLFFNRNKVKDNVESVYTHTHIYILYEVDLSFSSAGCKTEALNVIISLIFSDCFIRDVVNSK